MTRAPRNDLTELPIQSPMVCAILIGPSGMVSFANSVEDKQLLLEEYKRAVNAKSKRKPQLFAVWPGKNASHLFRLTEEKLTEVVEIQDTSGKEGEAADWERKHGVD